MQRGRTIRGLGAAGLVLAAAGSALASSLNGSPYVAGVAAGLLAAVVGVALWDRLPFVAAAGLAVAAVAALLAVLRALAAGSPSLAPLALLMACTAFAAAIAAIGSLPSRRTLVPTRHLAWPFAVGAAAGLWFFVLDASPGFLLADAFLGFGFAFAAAAVALPLRGRYTEAPDAPDP